MKKRSRIATACIAGVLATGLATAPAHAQGVEPNSSSQASGDALVGSAELPFLAILPLVQGSSLESPANTDAAQSLMPVAVIASLFSKQCHLGDTRGCFAQAQR